MHPLRFPILADENIHDEVVYFLRKQGLQIESIKERNLRGSTDNQIIALAQAEGRVIVTHDADFGRILHLSQGIKAGIIFLRPGHIDYSLDIQTLQSILATELNAEAPFILVAERSGDDIKIRLRIL
jgi:predicted nuclease of predicted toxin-antitoxin system